MPTATVVTVSPGDGPVLSNTRPESFSIAPGPECGCEEERQLRGHPGALESSGFLVFVRRGSPRAPTRGRVRFPLAAGSCSCSNSHPLNADEFQWRGSIALYFEAKFDRLTDLDHQFVQ